MGLDIIIQKDKNDENTIEWLFRIGYGSYHELMNEIARFFQLETINNYYFVEDDGCPEINLEKLVEFEGQKDFERYKKVVQDAGEKKVLIPLLMHSDCEGSIPVKLLKNMLPLLDSDEIKLWFKLNSDWDEQFFSLVKSIKKAVSKGCDFIYS